MSRYHGIQNVDHCPSVITPKQQGEAEPLTFTKKPKMEKSFLVSGGSAGGTDVRSSGVGEY